jgi:hypothetical protein
MLNMPDKLQNQLLAALERADYALLSPLLRTGYFEQGTILQEQGAPVTRVYFPLNGMVSLACLIHERRV